PSLSRFQDRCGDHGPGHTSYHLKQTNAVETLGSRFARSEPHAGAVERTHVRVRPAFDVRRFGEPTMITRRPDPPNTTAQPVETSWSAIMVAVADAIIGLPIPDHAHYQRFFEFRFNEVAPYRDIYLRFASTLNARSMKENGVDFLGAKPEARARLVANLLDHD